MLIGNNISLVIYGITMAGVIEPILSGWMKNDFWILLFQTIIATTLVLVTAEFIPKVLFRINPNQALAIFSIPALLIYYLLYPFVRIIIGISEFILIKVLQTTLFEENLEFGRIDLDQYLSDSNARDEKGNEEPEIQIFKNALDFSKVKLRDCMVPRTEIVALSIDDTISELKEKFVETGLSKILIYRNNIENIIGYTHSFEIFNNPVSITSILLPISLVPESMTANTMLSTFLKQQRSIAVVIDEFGGVAGIVTIEDVIEEIVGEIDDEHDKQELLEQMINEQEYLFAGRLEIGYLNEKYDLKLPESDEYETLSGLITHHHESIPKLNEVIDIGVFQFIVTKVNETRIEDTSLKILTNL
jgi:CBS domain containing-hemolysin-like protein